MADSSGGDRDRPGAGACRWRRRGGHGSAPHPRWTAGLTAPLAAGLLLSAAVCRLGAASLAAAAPPSEPSLAPLDVEAFRSRYGQETLFRLRLGVGAGRDDGSPCPANPVDWNGSPQRRLFEAELGAGRPYAAGQWLGAWQIRQQRCGRVRAAEGATSAGPH